MVEKRRVERERKEVMPTWHLESKCYPDARIRARIDNMVMDADIINVIYRSHMSGLFFIQFH